MDLRRRRSQSKGREPTADERLDALLEEARASGTPKEPVRRAQSLEPSRMLTPSLRKTSSALTAGASRERPAPEEVRAIENREREVPTEPQGQPMSFWPVVPPLPTGALPPFCTWTPCWRTSRRARRWWWGTELAAASPGASLGDVGGPGNASAGDVGRKGKPITNADLAGATRSWWAYEGNH